jgi:hypothetical protein
VKVEETYGVILLQATGETTVIKESTDFAECKALFDKIESELEKARKTKGALFKLRDPFIFSCDPSLIVRISLVPKKVPKVTDSQNPYQKRMEKFGFSETFKNPTIGSELLDEGYNNE